jgi:hypothetical protein
MFWYCVVTQGASNTTATDESARSSKGQWLSGVDLLRPWNLNAMPFDQPDSLIQSIVFVAEA